MASFFDRLAGRSSFHTEPRRLTIGAVFIVKYPTSPASGRLLKARLRGADLPPFCYRDFGTMTIGRKRMVVQLGRLKLSGFPAWHYGASSTFTS
jgi:hypothetical protein